MRRLFLFVVLIAAAACSLLAAPPGWWTDSPTAILDTSDPASVEDNYSPANLGQLKNVAKQAKAHLDAHLPGGAGSEVNALIASFGENLTPEERAANYSPANLGQLKAVAKPFYQRLHLFSYELTDPPVGRDATTGFPWTAATTDDDNYAPANLGQLKRVFSFDLSAPPGQLPEWWQKHYFNGQTGIDPNADADGDGLTNTQELMLGSNPINADGDGDGMPDGWEVAHGLDPLFNDAGANADGDEFTNLEEFLAGLDPLDPTNGQPSSVTTAPPAPTDVKADKLETEAIVSWTDTSANELLFFIERSDNGGSWHKVGTVPANTSSFTDHNLRSAGVYYYRVISRNNVPE